MLYIVQGEFMQHPVHTQLLTLTRSERLIKIEILNYLEKAEAIKYYLPKYFNLFDYCRKELGYTDSEAQRRIDAMRMLRRHPELKPKVLAEKITASQLTELNKADIFLKKEGRQGSIDSILPLIENKSVRETKEIIHQELNIPDRRKVILSVEEGTYQKWIEIKNRNFKLSEDKLLNLMIEATNKLQNEPVVVRKFEQDSRNGSPNIKLTMLQAAKFQCEWQGGCTNTANLHLDHIIPWSQGGKTEYMNLQILCQTHNNFKNGPKA